MPLHVLIGHELIHALRIGYGAQQPRPLGTWKQPNPHAAETLVPLDRTEDELRTALRERFGVSDVEEALVTDGPDIYKVLVSVDSRYADLKLDATAATGLVTNEAELAAAYGLPARFYSLVAIRAHADHRAAAARERKAAELAAQRPCPKA